MFWTGLEGRVSSLLAGAERSVLFVAPFAKAAVLRDLLKVIRPGVDVQLYTRWRAEEVAMGVTDTTVLSIVEARGGSAWLVDELHAKLVAVDLCRAIAGSANLTRSGLGTSAKPNLEIMLDVNERAVVPFVAELRRRSRRATDDEAMRVEDLAAEMRIKLGGLPKLHSVATASRAENWVPRFRSPDRLFHLYSDPEWLLTAAPDHPALSDLADLCPPAGLDERVFRSHVRGVLLDSPVVMAVDAVISGPQRFGAITGALCDLLPSATPRERQASVQTLIRWLIYFAGDRYGLETPNYSEILFRRR